MTFALPFLPLFPTTFTERGTRRKTLKHPIIHGDFARSSRRFALLFLTSFFPFWVIWKYWWTDELPIFFDTFPIYTTHHPSGGSLALQTSSWIKTKDESRSFLMTTYLSPFLWPMTYCDIGVNVSLMEASSLSIYASRSELEVPPSHVYKWLRELAVSFWSVVEKRQKEVQSKQGHIYLSNITSGEPGVESENLGCSHSSLIKPHSWWATLPRTFKNKVFFFTYRSTDKFVFWGKVFYANDAPLLTNVSCVREL